MPSPEKTGSSELDITALHSEPEPEDKVLSTEDAVAKMKEKSKLNLPAAGAGVSRPKGPEPAPSPDKDKDKKQAPKGKQAATPVAGPLAQPAITGAPKQPVATRAAHERAKTPEEKAEAYANYFKDVRTHEEFLRKITAMPSDKTLQEVVGIAELEKTASAAYKKVLVWQTAFEAKRKTIQPLILIEFAEKAAAKLPNGFRSVLRRIVHEALMPTPPREPKAAKREEPPSAPPAAGGAPSPAPTTAAGGEKPPMGGLSAEAILADMRALKARQAAAASAPSPEKSAAAPAEKAGVVATSSSEKPATLQFKAGDFVMHKDWKAPRRISFVKEEGGVQKAFAGSTTGVPLSELVASTPEAKPPEAATIPVSKPPEAASASKSVETPPIKPPMTDAEAEAILKATPGRRERTDFTLEQTKGLKIGDMVMLHLQNKDQWNHPAKIIRFEELEGEPGRAYAFTDNDEGWYVSALVKQDESTPKGLTPEQIAALTFEKLFELPREQLPKVVRVVSAERWATAVQGLADPRKFEGAIKDAAHESRKGTLEEAFMVVPAKGPEEIGEARAYILRIAKGLLAPATEGTGEQPK